MRLQGKFDHSWEVSINLIGSGLEPTHPKIMNTKWLTIIQENVSLLTFPQNFQADWPAIIVQ